MSCAPATFIVSPRRITAGASVDPTGARNGMYQIGLELNLWIRHESDCG
jgi:hypothetical protein